MAEYWKSTPKYWCKFCLVYVKDTKFERAQHEATGRHQGNIQRSLKGLHREQEIDQRNKARAQAEVARLNGLVSSTSSPSVAAGTGGAATFEKRPEKKATVEDRKRQWEQLVAMGITVPDAARGDLAIAGEWKTVSEEVVGEVNEDGEFKVTALNKGVRKRKIDEEEEEREAAGEIITKKKGWGHKFKTFPGSKSADDDIESLLGKKPIQATQEPEVKREDSEGQGVKAEREDDTTAKTLQDIPTAEEAEAQDAATAVKQEEDPPAAPVTPAVVFKKRKKIAK
ncbi:U1 zinc finger domain-containing protein [Plenodomus tracheiphilus IPT5]|uniref:U1 zinc finger domain-containing protein n=1 Tax=Plenodomus tracheiphilus IPT5 TaxID=1408161 RepID=A0A6A7BNU2_9PLEO|nr:U1 zinc finger domain-containing protein [Plenodomus tracheiphilus IPT5]